MPDIGSLPPPPQLCFKQSTSIQNTRPIIQPCVRLLVQFFKKVVKTVKCITGGTCGG